MIPVESPTVPNADVVSNNICKKKSPLIDKLGEELYSKKLCIINDGLREKGYGSMTFDAEGWPTQKTFLVNRYLLGEEA